MPRVPKVLLKKRIHPNPASSNPPNSAATIKSHAIVRDIPDLYACILLLGHFKSLPSVMAISEEASWSRVSTSRDLSSPIIPGMANEGRVATSKSLEALSSGRLATRSQIIFNVAAGHHVGVILHGKIDQFRPPCMQAS